MLYFLSDYTEGTLLFDKETKRLTWKDEKENVAKDLVFEKK